MGNEEIHIGKHIRNEMRRQGRRAVWLAEQLGCHRNNVYLIYSRSWIDTETLMKISTALRHDFFADLSKVFLSENYGFKHPMGTTNTPSGRR